MDAQLPRPGCVCVGGGLDVSQGRVPCPLSSRVGEGGGGMVAWEGVGRREGSVNN